jgi:hypothetical protein
MNTRSDRKASNTELGNGTRFCEPVPRTPYAAIGASPSSLSDSGSSELESSSSSLARCACGLNHFFATYVNSMCRFIEAALASPGGSASRRLLRRQTRRATSLPPLSSASSSSFVNDVIPMDFTR